MVCDVAWLKAGLCPVHTLPGSTYPPPILWMEICCFQWFTRMIRYKVLLGKDLAAESSQERAYEPFRVCRTEWHFSLFEFKDSGLAEN